jgi:chorismate mutase
MLKTCSSLMLIALTLIAPYASATDAPASLAPLIDTIKERLYIADKLAIYKLHKNLPVADRGREDSIIASAKLEGATHEIPTEETRQLFLAQIEAGKMVQYALLAEWQSLGHVPDKPAESLAGILRPQLSQLQTRLLQTYAEFASSRHDPACLGWIKQARERQILDPIHDFALVRAVGELCVVKREGA